MEREQLLDQIDFAQARIEEIEHVVINANPTEKGFKELIESYNKCIDRYDELITREEHFDDETLESRKLDIEEMKVKVETEKLEIEKKRIAALSYTESEKLEFERQKFDKEVGAAKWKDPVDIALRVGELGIKVAVPIIGIVGTMAVAKLAYINDAELKLCNGRIFASAKELIKLTTTKV